MGVQLKKITASSGFLERCEVRFSPQLTCIIGARGTCKSTLIESIRFAFNCNPERVQELTAGNGQQSAEGMIRATLGPGTVSCEISALTEEGPSTYSVERELDSEPRVYHNGVQEIEADGVVENVEIYSQGELQRIADDYRLRLRLIDRAHQAELRSNLEQTRSLANELRRIGQELRTIRQAMASRQVSLRELEHYQQELSNLKSSEPQMPSALQEERKGYEWRLSVVAYAESKAQAYQQVRSELQAWTTKAAALGEAAEYFQELDVNGAKPLSTPLAAMIEFVNAVRACLHKTPVHLNSELQGLRQALQAMDSKYLELQRTEETVNAYLKRKDALTRNIHILEKVKQEFQQLAAKECSLQEQRREHRAQMERLADELFNLRLNEVDRINEQFSSRVILTLSQGTQTREYREALGLLLSRSRLRDQADIASDIADKLRPSELVDLVESGAAEKLAERLQRDTQQMMRCVSHLAEVDGLYDLEAVSLDDELEIQLYDRGVPKRVDQLSKGQKATALLPLILREADYPLLFDQPEDDLDNSFIYETLVRTVQKLKLNRQLIIVTHNANIPVLGDAESVVVMSMESPRKAGPATDGDIDEMREHILQLLEGGKEAFELRRKRYQADLR